MKFVEVTEYPRKNGKGFRCKNQARLEEFMNMNIKAAIAEFDENEYSSLKSARESLYKSAQRFGYPIDLRQDGDKLYFVRKDM